MGVIIGAIAIAMVVASSSLVMPASAGKDNAQGGLNNADENVHENTDSTPDDLSKQDVKFHQGTCQGGHETEAVGEIFENGCDDIPPPGNSDDNRQDD